jgi:TrmH family RNA methyltransferase
MRPGSGPLFTERTPRVVAARALTRRARRDAERLFLAEGPQAVREALALDPDGPGGVRALFVGETAQARHVDLLGLAGERGIDASVVVDAAMAGLSETVTPQGIVAVCGFLDRPLEAVLQSSPELVVVLFEVNDPGNAGTVLRTADAAGAGAVLFTDGSVDAYNGKCVRASAGSVFHPQLVRGGEPGDVIRALQAAGLRVLAADGAGESDLDAEQDSGRLGAPTAWLFGNEARGLSEEIAGLADARIRIPIYGGAESLNLAAAAAVCLYASARAQRG